MRFEQIVICGRSPGKSMSVDAFARYTHRELKLLFGEKPKPNKGPQPRKKYGSR